MVAESPLALIMFSIVFASLPSPVSVAAWQGARPLPLREVPTSTQDAAAASVAPGGTGSALGLLTAVLGSPNPVFPWSLSLQACDGHPVERGLSSFLTHGTHEA